MATKYVTQAGSGGATGVDLANAWSMAQLNAASPAAGDLIILNGTLTSTLTVPTSGSSGNPIVYQFASGAAFSKAFWGITTAAAIYATGKSFITIDGASVGIIECTANGDSLANQQQSHGISLVSCNDWEVKNITIRNIFIHTYNINNPGGVNPYTTVCMKADNCNRISLHDSTLHNAYDALYYLTSSVVALSTVNFYNNTVYACSTAVVVGIGSSGSSIDVVNLYGNDVTMGLNWFDPLNANHVDGFHCWGLTGDTSPITNLSVYRNYFHGDPGTQCTAPIFLEYTITNPIIYDNIIICITNHPTQGCIYVKQVTGNASNSTARVMNNTCVGLGTTSAGGVGYCSDSIAGMTHYLQNNIFSTLYVGIYEPSGNGTMSSDYNCLYNLGNTGWRTVSSGTLAAWQGATSGDAHSINTDPQLTGTFTIPTTSPCKDTGTSMATYFTVDYAGISRPQGAAWDIGAYEYVTGGGGGSQSGGSPSRAIMFR